MKYKLEDGKELQLRLMNIYDPEDLELEKTLLKCFILTEKVCPYCMETAVIVRSNFFKTKVKYYCVKCGKYIDEPLDSYDLILKLIKKVLNKAVKNKHVLNNKISFEDALKITFIYFQWGYKKELDLIDMSFSILKDDENPDNNLEQESNK